MMARTRRNDDLMRLAAVSAAVSLTIVLVFFGGTITGSSHSTDIAVDMTITSTTSCNLSTNTLTNGAVALATAGQTFDEGASFNLENNGTAYLNITFGINQSMDGFLGFSGSAFNFVSSGGVNGTAGTPMGVTTVDFGGATTTTAMGDLLVPTDGGDDTISYAVTFDTPATSTRLGSQELATITVTCSGDTDGS